MAGSGTVKRKETVIQELPHGSWFDPILLPIQATAQVGNLNNLL